MLSSKQTELFNKGYGAYRDILKLLADNSNILKADADDDAIPALVMMADMEIQKMLLDISSCDEYMPTEDEQEYIKSLIESTEALKALIPGYGKFYRNMTPANYQTVKTKFDELSQDVPIALGLAVELQKRGLTCVDQVIEDYQTIFDSFSAISEFEEHRQNEKVSDWLLRFREYAERQGVSTKISHTNNEGLGSNTTDEETEGEVARDSVVQVESIPELNEMENALHSKWIGSIADVRNICNSFMRRYAGGKRGMHLKTNIVMLGAESRGKVFAAKCMARILKEFNLASTTAVPVVDFSEYSIGTDFIIFLSDLYRALYQISDVVVFANFEMADTKQLDALYQLMSKEIYHLDRRYVDRNGMLVDATGVLATETISEISSNGKSFVFTSSLQKTKATEFLGNKMLNEITDIIILDPLGTEEIKRLVDVLCAGFMAQCRRELSLNVTFAEELKEKLQELYESKSGAKGLINYFRLNVFNPLTDLCLSGRFIENNNVELTCENDEFWAVDENQRGVSLSEFVRAYNQVEIEKVQEELNGVIGLEEVKKYIHGLENNLKIQKLRANRGLKTTNISMHMIFTGNPGTGKTTIARIVAKYLKAIGVLTSGQLVEVTRADLVAQYVGQTAPKTTAAIKSAIGGVLFIDEAYSLCRDGHDSFGREAVDALVKGMEDNRDDLIVILAGYTKEMEDFMKANPGLKSRFPNVIHFDDYSCSDMYLIAQVTAAAKGYRIDDKCYEPLMDEFERHQIKGRNDSGNGRLVRNLLESAILRQSQRVVNQADADLELLTVEDFGFVERKPFDLEEKFKDIIGLESVKDIIRTQYKLLKAEKLRKEKGMQVDTTQALNMVFAGNPGTGKTTMARVVAEMFHELGIIKSGQLVETDKGGLVDKYVGHTAKKTEDVFRSALGGVLFVDEAYSITNESGGFGQECIDTLVKLVEEYREDAVVILAGYTKEMKEFMKSNSGLESRFPIFIEFPDYSAEELYEIGKVIFKNKGFILSDDGDVAFKKEVYTQKNVALENAGNGRMVRNIVEKIVRQQSVRIADGSYEASDLNVIIADDIISNSDGFKKYDLEAELDKIVGLAEVKDFIRTQYRMCLAREKREQAALQVDTSQALNMIFTGNPGTGKTTVTRMMAEMFKNMGILAKGHVVETDRGGLISEFVGQTSQKTEEVFKSAIGGILFIDEAYGITNGGGEFGQECIDTLVKLIEDYKGKIIVVLAGYTREMNAFLKFNSGLESRFPLRIEFQDYSSDELYEIGQKMIHQRGFDITEEADEVFKEEIKILKRHSNANSGNGRMIRNFLERIIREQSSRIAMTDVNPDEMNLIIKDDICREDMPEGYDLEKEFENIIGLENVKQYIRSLNARLLIQAERKKAGLEYKTTQTLHMIFAGNPGTGKTMMARTVANVLYNMGVIHKNKLVETDRAGLVAGYVGQTAIKTQEVIESALDGVLFIDEAYSLAQGGENDFGKEAIDTLVKMMDDKRDRLVVILAGYSDEMGHFLNMNPGLKSRFANIIEFPDYSTDELLSIADKLYENQGYSLCEDAIPKLREILEMARDKEAFGNGRFVRNIIEKSLNAQALRLSKNSVMNTSDLSLIVLSDIDSIAEDMEELLKNKPRIGFNS